MSKKHRTQARAQTQAKEAPKQAAAQEQESSDDGRWKKISAAAHAAGGAGMGALSYVIGNIDYALVAGVIILYAMWMAIRHLSGPGRKSVGWWAANGLFLYLFIWLDAWVVLYNFF
jgi:hypothetical protein